MKLPHFSPRNQKILFALYLIGIVLIITLPINSGGEFNNIHIIHIRGDYFFHILLFVPWALFQASFKFRLLPWLGLGLLISVGAEFIQYFLSYRAFNINDMLANGLGILLGMILFWLWRWIRK